MLITVGAIKWATLAGAGSSFLGSMTSQAIDGEINLTKTLIDSVFGAFSGMGYGVLKISGEIVFPIVKCIFREIMGAFESVVTSFGLDYNYNCTKNSYKSSNSPYQKILKIQVSIVQTCLNILGRIIGINIKLF